MPQDSPSLIRRILSVAAEIVVAIYMVFNGIVGQAFGPVMRSLSALRLIQRLEQAIAGLPPYVILVLLVVPFAFAELAKVYAVVMMAEDHFRSGLTIFIGAYVVSILVCERTFQAGKSQLMKIGWFKALIDWVVVLKGHVMGWFRQRRVWRLAGEMQQRVRTMVRRSRLRLSLLMGGRPKRTFERP